MVGRLADGFYYLPFCGPGVFQQAAEVVAQAPEVLRVQAGKFKAGFVPGGARLCLYEEHSKLANIKPATQGVVRARAGPQLFPVRRLYP